MNTDGEFSLPLKEPPASIEAEQALIGSCLMDPAVIDAAADLIEPGDFFRDAHGELWRALLAIRESGRHVCAVAVADLLGPRFAAMRGYDLLGEIMARTPHSANGLYYAGIVRSKATIRRLMGAASETLRDCQAGEGGAEEIVGRAEARIFAIREREASGGVVGSEVLIRDTALRIAMRQPGAVDGVQTGFDDLDHMTAGFRPEDFVVVAARPSMGKTAFACAAAIRANVPTLMFSLEMNRDALGERLLASEAEIDSARLRRPWELSQGEAGALSAASGVLSGAALRIDDRPLRTVSQMAATARRMKSRGGLGLVVIDYLSLIDGQRQKGENRQEEVARISRRLKAMARELGCPVMCLHQLNRQNEGREGHRPRLSDLRESGQIEQDADMVLLLHRPEYYDPNDQPGIAEVIVAKNRNGPTGAMRLLFKRHCTRFEPLPVQPAF
jgi:replicative DNA helicase